jgi:hypothetical protein
MDIGCLRQERALCCAQRSGIANIGYLSSKAIIINILKNVEVRSHFLVEGLHAK